MSLVRMFAAGIALAAVAATSASAQDYRLNPTYGTVTLTAGFTPDPQVVAVQSGGSINAQTLNPACAGYIANAPDVRLNYTIGTGLPLIISVASNADTTLVINGPDGSWYCDDDSGNAGMSPMVRFAPPASGQYDIWVGTYGNSSLQQANLYISELTSQ